MMSRQIRAHGLRVADADPEDLAALVDLHRQVDEAIATAVAGLRRRHSWAQIARGLGTSRQAAAKRWGQSGGKADAVAESAHDE
jgi:hypothetical protein